jgi:hypothetical protein
MSSRKFEPPLHIDLARSRWLLILLLAIHGGAGVLVLLFETPWWINLALLALVLVSAVISLYKSDWLHWTVMGRRLWLRWQPVPRMIWQSDNDWQLTTGNGQEVLAELLPTSTCQPAFVALNFRTDKNRWLDRYFSVVIVADAIDPEIFRQLRVRLRTRFVQGQDN